MKHLEYNDIDILNVKIIFNLYVILGFVVSLLQYELSQPITQQCSI